MNRTQSLPSRSYRYYLTGKYNVVFVICDGRKPRAFLGAAGKLQEGDRHLNWVVRRTGFNQLKKKKGREQEGYPGRGSTYINHSEALHIWSQVVRGSHHVPGVWVWEEHSWGLRRVPLQEKLRSNQGPHMLKDLGVHVKEFGFSLRDPLKIFKPQRRHHNNCLSERKLQLQWGKHQGEQEQRPVRKLLQKATLMCWHRNEKSEMETESREVSEWPQSCCPARLLTEALFPLKSILGWVENYVVTPVIKK